MYDITYHPVNLINQLQILILIQVDRVNLIIDQHHY